MRKIATYVRQFTDRFWDCGVNVKGENTNEVTVIGGYLRRPTDGLILQMDNTLPPKITVWPTDCLYKNEPKALINMINTLLVAKDMAMMTDEEIAWTLGQPWMENCAGANPPWLENWSGANTYKLSDIRKLAGVEPKKHTTTPITYKYTSTKEYVDAFPCAYRQYLTDSHCNKLHGYAYTMKFYFGTNDLDSRNFVADYGGLKELKAVLESQFDHTTLCSEDDPDLGWFKEAEKRGIMKLTILPKLGCESIADMLYKYVNAVYIPQYWGEGESKRLWCYRVEVRETQANMAFREGHREWGEDLLGDV